MRWLEATYFMEGRLPFHEKKELEVGGKTKRSRIEHVLERARARETDWRYKAKSWLNKG